MYGVWNGIYECSKICGLYEERIVEIGFFRPGKCLRQIYDGTKMSVLIFYNVFICK